MNDFFKSSSLYQAIFNILLIRWHIHIQALLCLFILFLLFKFFRYYFEFSELFQAFFTVTKSYTYFNHTCQKYRWAWEILLYIVKRSEGQRDELKGFNLYFKYHHLSIAMFLQKCLLSTRKMEHSNFILTLVCFMITSPDTYVQNPSVNRLTLSILCIRKCIWCGSYTQ